MGEWYVILDFALTGLAAAVCLVAGDRIRWLGVALLVNFLLCTLAVIYGIGGWHLKVIASVLDLGMVAGLVFAMRAYPMSHGLDIAMTVMVFSLFSHWAAHAALVFTGDGYNLIYFAITNSAIAIASLGLIWTGLSLIGARHGLVDRVSGTVAANECWRAPVGARKKALPIWTN